MSNSVLNNFSESITLGIENLYDIVFEYADSLCLSARLICGLFAFIYIGSKLWKSWSLGESIDFYSMLRPVGICLLIFFFSGFTFCLDMVINPVNALVNHINFEAQQDFVSNESNYNSAFLDLRNKKAEVERALVEELGEDIDTVSSVSQIFTGSTESFYLFYWNLLIDFLSQLLVLLSSIIALFFQVYIVLAKLVLVLIGPFAFAFAILPGYSSNIKYWISHYINISLYVPICSLLALVYTIIINTCLYIPSVDAIQELVSQDSNQLTYDSIQNFMFLTNISYIIISVIMILLYTQVKRFASWILKPDGSSLIYNSIQKNI